VESDCNYLGEIAPDAGVIGATMSVFYTQKGSVCSDLVSEIGLLRVKFFEMFEVKKMIEISVISDGITLATLLKYLNLKSKIEW
jgi:hypothetical protein